LVDCRRRHRVGVEVAVVWVDTAADRQPCPRAEYRHDDGGIAGAVVRHTDQRLEDAAALHLVVVLADDALLAAHVVRRQDSLQRVVEINGASRLAFSPLPAGERGTKRGGVTLSFPLTPYSSPQRGEGRRNVPRSPGRFAHDLGAPV